MCLMEPKIETISADGSRVSDHSSQEVTDQSLSRNTLTGVEYIKNIIPVPVVLLLVILSIVAIAISVPLALLVSLHGLLQSPS